MRAARLYPRGTRVSRSVRIILALAIVLIAAGAAVELTQGSSNGDAMTPRTPVAAAGAPHATFYMAAAEQSDRGRSVYLNSCAKCHGQQGEGGDGPRLIGSPNGLPDYKTAQGLFDFVSSQMPNDDPGTLKTEEYWDILAFILDANRLLPPDTVLGPDNAGNIRLAP